LEEGGVDFHYLPGSLITTVWPLARSVPGGFPRPRRTLGQRRSLMIKFLGKVEFQQHRFY
jgi:hypothetical protein